MSITSASLSGMNAAQAALGVAAQNIAQAAAPGPRRLPAAPTEPAGRAADAVAPRTASPGDDLAADVVGQLQAKNAFLVNLRVFQAGDRMMGALLDTRA